MLDHVVDVRLGRQATLIGFFQNFLPMLVRAGQKKDVVTFEAAVASQGVGGCCGVHVADVRSPIHIVDRGGNVEKRPIFHEQLRFLGRGFPCRRAPWYPAGLSRQ